MGHFDQFPEISPSVGYLFGQETVTGATPNGRSALEAVIPPTRSSCDFVELDVFGRLVDLPAETGKVPAVADRPDRQLTM